MRTKIIKRFSAATVGVCFTYALIRLSISGHGAAQDPHGGIRRNADPAQTGCAKVQTHGIGGAL